MIKAIDNFLNKITMYRLVLYVLFAYIVIGIIFGFAGWIPYSGLFILLEFALITVVCYIANLIFAKIWKVPANVESVYITAFILVLLIAPPLSWTDTWFYSFAVWASAIAMGSKYILTIKKKHIFNPAAVAVVITALVFGQAATWWIGSVSLLPFVIIGGFLIVRKLRRFDLPISFLIVSLVGTLISLESFSTFDQLTQTIWQIAASTPLFFFATVMLTEPQTTPPIKKLRILYGILVGLLYSPLIHIGQFYYTPEMALVIGNIFAYIVSPKEKLLLTFKAVEKVALDTYNFLFISDKKISFRPGQYLEWTLSPEGADLRGNRRYFTIASSPTEDHITIGVKFYPNSSTFKQKLRALTPGETAITSGRAGDFVLPDNKNKKLVFLAGGIGITPFRSMTKYLLHNNEKRNIILLYSNKTVEDIAYKEIFQEASEKLGLKTSYILTGTHTPSGWQGKTGHINKEMIENEIPDFKERIFYISGPQAFVTASEEALKKLGIKRKNIKKDYFPGYV